MAILKINSDLAGHLNKENIHSDDAKDDLSDTASGFYDDEASEKSLNDDYMDEEPVSPPPCPPDEAPQLLMSQTIEENHFQELQMTSAQNFAYSLHTLKYVWEEET